MADSTWFRGEPEKGTPVEHRPELELGSKEEDSHHCGQPNGKFLAQCRIKGSGQKRNKQSKGMKGAKRENTTWNPRLSLCVGEETSNTVAKLRDAEWYLDSKMQRCFGKG